MVDAYVEGIFGVVRKGAMFAPLTALACDMQADRLRRITLWMANSGRLDVTAMEGVSLVETEGTRLETTVWVLEVQLVD